MTVVSITHECCVNLAVIPCKLNYFFSSESWALYLSFDIKQYSSYPNLKACKTVSKMGARKMSASKKWIISTKVSRLWRTPLYNKKSLCTLTINSLSLLSVRCYLLLLAKKSLFKLHHIYSIAYWTINTTCYIEVLTCYLENNQYLYFICYIKVITYPIRMI